MLLRKIDSYGTMGWLTVTIVAFWMAWPLALLIIAYLVGSGRVEGWRSEMRMPETWFNLGTTVSSGNQAFEDYRKQTLTELETEQREFQSSLEQLRAARDKAEFDAFMAQGRKRSIEADPAA